MLKPGATLENNKYRIESVLGQGGFGYVYRASEQLTGETLAIKELVPGLVGDPQMVKRFIQEARATLRLTHPNIARTFNIFSEGDTYYLTMEYLPGGSLSQHISRGPVPPKEAVRVTAELCAALEYAHGEGVVHCDIKPANVLFSQEGRAHLADFGIAYVSDQLMTRQMHTGTGAVMGTMRYMAPEQLEGVRDDPRLDIYAMGALLYEMLAGRPYLDFESETTPAAQMRNMQRIQTSPPRPLQSAAPAVSDGLAQAVERALRKKPEDRYPSVAAFRRALQVTVPDRAAPPAQAPPPAAGPPPARAAAAAAALRLALPDGHDVALGSGSLTVGRDPSCDVVLDDGEVSRRHASIQVTSQGARVVDLGSTNGSFVNGQRLEPNKPRLMRKGDELRLGAHLTLKLKGGEAMRPPAAAPAHAPPPPPAGPTRMPGPQEQPRRRGAPGWLWVLLIGLALVALAVLAVLAYMVFGPSDAGAGADAVTVIASQTYTHTATPEASVTTDLSATPGPSLTPTLTDTVAPPAATTEAPPLPPPATTAVAPLPPPTTEAPPPPPATTVAPPPPTGPNIAFFQAAVASITAGDCTTLEWGAVTNATEVTIDHGIGGVGTPGNTSVCPPTSTTYTMTAVGPGGTLQESVAISVQAGQPDLVVQSIDFVPSPPIQNQNNELRITIRNVGNGPAGAFNWEWQPGSAAPLGGTVGGGLNAGDTTVVTANWHPSSWYANLPTQARVDTGGAVTESNEGNNTRDKTIAVAKPSAFTTHPPGIDGAASPAEWGDAPLAAGFSHGRILYMNNNNYLYLLVDVTGDTGNQLGSGDYFWLAFDVNENRNIDSNVDIQYGLYPNTTNMGLTYFLGPGGTTGLNATSSQMTAGFGPSPASGSAHVIWEFALRFSEIQAGPGQTVRFGVRHHSDGPNFTDDVPVYFQNDFGTMVEINLGSP